jgi:hypothetical protein
MKKDSTRAKIRWLEPHWAGAPFKLRRNMVKCSLGVEKEFWDNRWNRNRNWKRMNLNPKQWQWQCTKPQLHRNCIRIGILENRDNPYRFVKYSNRTEMWKYSWDSRLVKGGQGWSRSLVLAWWDAMTVSCFSCILSSFCCGTILSWGASVYGWWWVWACGWWWSLLVSLAITVMVVPVRQANAVALCCTRVEYSFLGDLDVLASRVE